MPVEPLHEHLQELRQLRPARRSRGFTLVELLVSMVAGLAVVMAVVSLGRDSTTQFHEEMKVATAQMTQRLAAQRLRADLERVGFMATGNMLKDPLVAHCQSSSAPCTAADAIGAAPTYITTPGETGLSTLMSVRLNIGGSATGDADVAAYSAFADNTLNPDSIELTGNFTTSDEFSASIQQPAAGNACGGARIYLESKDPAVLRFIYNRDGAYDNTWAAATNALMAAFSPVHSGANVPFRFGVRVSDFSLTHYQFVAICDKAGSIGVDATSGLPRPYIDTLRQLMTQDLGIGGVVPGQGAGSAVVVNPVQTVRWEIARRANSGNATIKANGQLMDGTTNNPDLTKGRFELIRTWVPYDVAPFAVVTTTSPVACTMCQELVAEFAVDLKFGFSTYAIATKAITDYDFDESPTGTPTAATIAPATATNGTPQLIRSIRVRLGTRAALTDRQFKLTGAPATFLYRYQLGAGAYARARETVEEVFLSNQTSMTYP